MTPTPEQTARAFEIADEAMFDAVLDLGVGGDEYQTVITFTDDSHQEVTSLAEASTALREAFEWLRQRGYVELGSDKDGEFVQVVRRPGED